MKTRPRLRCPGCSHPIPRAEAWCVPCEKRMPADLQKAVVQAERSLSAARAEAIQWLGEHPHATTRELEVIAFAAQGLDNDQIAERLHLSVHTVRDHWRRLSQRWGCRGRAHVVATAFRLGYLTLEVRA